MKTIVITLLIVSYIICIEKLNAQTFSTRLEHNTTVSKSAYSIAGSSGSNLIALSEVNISDNFRNSVILITTSPNGIIEDVSSYATIDSSYSINTQQIAPLLNGDILISGIYSPNNAPPYSPYILSLDENKNIKWAKKINGNGNSTISNPYLKILSDNSILYTFKYKDSTIHQVFCKIDTNGNFTNILKSNPINGNIQNIILNDSSFDLLLTDGNLININNDLSAIGWQKKINHLIGIEINKAVNGDYLIASAQVAFPGHMTVTRMDSVGNVVWSKYLEFTTGVAQIPFDIVGFHLIAETMHGNILVIANSEGGSDGSLFVTFDESGNYISNYKTNSFHNSFSPVMDFKLLYGGFLSLGDMNTSNFALSKLRMGDYLDCDTTYDYTIAEGNQIILIPDSFHLISDSAFNVQNILIEKIVENMSQQDHCNIILSSKKLNKIKTHTYIYPNPAKSFINVKSQHKIEEIKLFDINNRLILISEGNKLNINNISTGVYFLKIYTNGQIITEKLIKN